MTEDEQLMPWEVRPQPVEDTIALLQRDFAYAVANTAIVVHSNNPALVFTSNTQRGQPTPRGEVKFSDGTTVEFQDIGMCQPNLPHMTVQQIISRVLQIADKLGLELVK